MDPEDDVVTESDKPQLTAHELARLLLARRNNDVMVQIVDSLGGDLEVQPYQVAYDPAGDRVLIRARRHYA